MKKEIKPHLSIFHHSSGYSYQVLDGKESPIKYWMREDNHDPKNEDEYIESQDLPPLFAAAPELLKALIIARAFVHDKSNDDGALALAMDKIIAKAEGR